MDYRAALNFSCHKNLLFYLYASCCKKVAAQLKMNRKCWVFVKSFDWSVRRFKLSIKSSWSSPRETGCVEGAWVLDLDSPWTCSPWGPCGPGVGTGWWEGPGEWSAASPAPAQPTPRPSPHHQSLTWRFYRKTRRKKKGQLQDPILITCPPKLLHLLARYVLLLNLLLSQLHNIALLPPHCCLQACCLIIESMRSMYGPAGYLTSSQRSPAWGAAALSCSSPSSWSFPGWWRLGSDPCVVSASSHRMPRRSYGSVRWRQRVRIYNRVRTSHKYDK